MWLCIFVNHNTVKNQEDKLLLLQDGAYLNSIHIMISLQPFLSVRAITFAKHRHHNIPYSSTKVFDQNFKDWSIFERMIVLNTFKVQKLCNVRMVENL